MIFPEINITIWLFYFEFVSTLSNGFLPAALVKSMLADDDGSLLEHHYITGKPGDDPAAKKERGFYYHYRHTKMVLHFRDSLLTDFETNRFYCHKRSFENLCSYLDQSKFPNDIEYNKAVAHVRSMYIDRFKEKDNFLQLGTGYPYPPS